MSMYVEITELLGKTLRSVIVSRDNDTITFVVDDNEKYIMNHVQDCCESVVIEDINGDINDLIGSEILIAEENTSDKDPLDKYDESFTWTFYKLATAKGYVDIRWYGSSNGYYSESVDITRHMTGKK